MWVLNIVLKWSEVDNHLFRILLYILLHGAQTFPVQTNDLCFMKNNMTKKLVDVLILKQ